MKLRTRLFLVNFANFTFVAAMLLCILAVFPMFDNAMVGRTIHSLFIVSFGILLLLWWLRVVHHRR